MKSLLYSLVIIVFSIAIFSCSKNKDSTPPHPIVGLWQGKYGLDPVLVPQAFMSILFRSDGTLRRYDAWDTASAVKEDGTYTITGTTIFYTHVYAPNGTRRSGAGTSNAAFTHIDGTWGYGTSTSDGGKIILDKK